MRELLVIEKLPFPVHLLELYQQLAECTQQPLDTLAFDLFQVLSAEPSGLDRAIHDFILNEHFTELTENNQTYSPENLTEGMSFLIEYLKKGLIDKFSRDCFKHMASIHMTTPTDVQIIFVFNQPKQNNTTSTIKKSAPWRPILLT